MDHLNEAFNYLFQTTDYIQKGIKMPDFLRRFGFADFRSSKWFVLDDDYFIINSENKISEVPTKFYSRRLDNAVYQEGDYVLVVMEGIQRFVGVLLESNKIADTGLISQILRERD